MTDLLDLHDKVVLVTGGARGLGYYVIQILARQGAKVYMAARDEGRAQTAIKQLEAEGLAGGSVHWLKLDMLDPRNAVSAAKEFMDKEQRLDILVNNASMGFPGPYVKNADGLLDITTVGYTSHFALVQALLPVLEKTAREPGSDVRIVNMTSMLHANVKRESLASSEALNIDYGPGIQNSIRNYAHGKLLALLHAKELQQRFDTAQPTPIPITCIAVHPGANRTDGAFSTFTLIPYLGGLLKLLLGWTFSAPQVGAMEIAFAAAGKAVKEDKQKYAGAYLMPVGKVSEPSPEAKDERLRKELWETSEKILAGLR